MDSVNRLLSGFHYTHPLSVCQTLITSFSCVWLPVYEINQIPVLIKPHTIIEYILLQSTSLAKWLLHACVAQLLANDVINYKMGSWTVWSFGSSHPQMMPVGRGIPPKPVVTLGCHPGTTQPSGLRPSGWVALGGNLGSWATQSHPNPNQGLYSLNKRPLASILCGKTAKTSTCQLPCP